MLAQIFTRRPPGEEGEREKERREIEKNGKGDSGRERKGLGKGGKVRKEGNEERKEKVPPPPHPSLIAPRREVGDITLVCVLVMTGKAGNLGSALSGLRETAVWRARRSEGSRPGGWQGGKTLVASLFIRFPVGQVAGHLHVAGPCSSQERGLGPGCL